MRHAAASVVEVTRFVGTAMRASSLRLMICLVLGCGSASAQTGTSARDCGTPESVLQRYTAALGGQAALDQVQTLVIDAQESEPHTFNPQETAHYRYEFKWKSPNKVAAIEPQFPFGSTAFLYNGSSWSNFDRRVSHNDDNTPLWRTELRASVYNDYPQFLMYRVVANPLLLATTPNLYRDYETLSGTPEMCVLQANGTSEWGRGRRDVLYFEAKSGLLRTWAIQMGEPGREIHSDFRFDDYRQTGPVKIPFSIYFDFYKASFRLTKVVPSAAISDAEFVAKP